jgi:hypothetical protein
VALLIPSAAITVSASTSPTPRRAELQPHRLFRVPLQHGEQLGARDADQPVVVPDHPAPICIVMSCRYPAATMSAACRVRVARFRCPGGQAPEADVVPVHLLVDDHVARRAGQLEQPRGVQPARPGPEHPDPP